MLKFFAQTCLDGVIERSHCMTPRSRVIIDVKKKLQKIVCSKIRCMFGCLKGGRREKIDLA